MRFFRAASCLFLALALCSPTTAEEPTFSFSSIWGRIWGTSSTRTPKVTPQQEDAIWRKTPRTMPENAGTQRPTISPDQILKDFGSGGKMDLGGLQRAMGGGEKKVDVNRLRKQLSNSDGISIDEIFSQHLKGREGGVEKVMKVLSDKKGFENLSRSLGGRNVKPKAKPPISQEQLLEMLMR